jgi:hypothetical protein
MANSKIKSDGRTITVRVPISIRKRGGRKIVLGPDGTSTDSSDLSCRHVDGALVKAIARAFRWRDALEKGTHATIVEIADTEKINETYVGRILRLTLLAPDLIEMILAGRQPAGITLVLLMKRIPVEWSQQRSGLLTLS